MLAWLLILEAASPTAPLFEAARSGDPQTIEALVDGGVEVDARAADGSTPLMLAARSGHASAVAALLSAGAAVNASNAYGATALMWGAIHPEVERVLLERGADPNAQASSGQTALMVASLSDASLETVRLLLQRGASVDAATHSGFTALMAATNATHDVVDLLLERGARATAANHVGWTALHGACTSGDAQMVEALLARGAVADAVESGFRTTPLMWAAARGSDRAVALLLSRGADANARESFRRGTALIWASAEGHDSTVRRLLAAGARSETQDEDALTPLDWARRAGAREVVAALSPAASVDVPPVASKRRAAPPWRKAVERSVALLQRTGPSFVAEAGDHCVSCHHQSLPAMALALARQRGFRLNEEAARAQVASTFAELDPRRDNLMLGAGAADPLDPAYFLVGLHAARAPSDETTEAMVHYLAVRQQSDGRWRALLHRPPMDDSDITSTALSARALQLYTPPGRTEEFAKRLSSAARWLAAATPRDTEEQTFQVLGLVWLGGHPAAVERGRAALLAQQRRDGGWGQLSALPSDAYATGEALVALGSSGAPAAVTARAAGVSFLLSHQEADGSWRVATRSLPVQSYFESGFPGDRSQFISCAATAWATMALLIR